MVTLAFKKGGGPCMMYFNSLKLLSCRTVAIWENVCWQTGELHKHVWNFFHLGFSPDKVKIWSKSKPCATFLRNKYTCSSPVCQQNFSGKVQSSVQLSIMVHVPFYVELTIFQLLYFESDRIVYCSDVRTRTSLSIVHTAGTDLREVDQSAVFNRHKKTQKYMVTRSVK